MNKLIRRTITVTIIETWTFIWTDGGTNTLSVERDGPPPLHLTSITRVVSSSTVSSQYTLENIQKESGDETGSGVRSHQF